MRIHFPRHRWFLPFAAVIASLTGRAQTYDLVRELGATDGQVKCMARKGDTLFVGGDFFNVHQALAYGAVLSASSGLAERRADQASDAVTGAVPDGHGGWFVGGRFTHYNDEQRSGMAHVRADGTITPWAPEVDQADIGLATGVVAQDGNWLFSAGDLYITAVDTATGANIGWTVNSSGHVHAMAVHDGLLFVGSDMPQPLMAIDIPSGTPAVWAVSSNGTVNTLLATPTALLAGGAFTTMAGSIRNGLAALAYDNALCTAWNPDVQGTVNAMTLNNDTLYFGGEFTAVSGNDRSRLAAVNVSSGTLLNWAPVADAAVNDLALSPGLVHAVGGFSTIDGTERRYLAAVDAVTGALSAWSAPAPEIGIALIRSNGADGLYIGGDFQGLGWAERHRVAAFSLSTGLPLAWSHDLAGVVNALCTVGDRLFIGGEFDQVDGILQQRFAAFDLGTDALLPALPTVAGTVNCMAVHGSRLYIGGAFDYVNNISRPRTASFMLPSLELTGWNPQFIPTPYAFAFQGNTVFVGNDPDIDAIDTLTSLLRPWSPVMDYGVVYTAVVHEGTLYFGGESFGDVNGVQRYSAAAINANDGTLLDWAPNEVSAPYKALGANATAVYAGGSFYVVGSNDPRGLVALDPLSGDVLSTADQFGVDGVDCLVVDDSMLIAGGSFRTHYASCRRGLAAYRITNDISTGSDATDALHRTHLRPWPDPCATGQALCLMMPSGSVPSTVRIVGVDGRWMKTFQPHTEGPVLRINVDALPPQVYTVQVEDLKGERYTARFVKE